MLPDEQKPVLGNVVFVVVVELGRDHYFPVVRDLHLELRVPFSDIVPAEDVVAEFMPSLVLGGRYFLVHAEEGIASKEFFDGRGRDNILHEHVMDRRCHRRRFFHHLPARSR